MVVFIRSFTRKFDGKLNKYLAVLNASGVRSHFLGWNRGGVIAESSCLETYYNGAGELGKGWSSVLDILRWNVFVLRWLVSNRKTIEVVHAIDLDCALVAWLFCKVFRKKIIFDIYDKYSSLRTFPTGISNLVDSVERYLIKHSDLTILADACRFAQHNIPDDQHNILVLENVPPPFEKPPSSRQIKAPFQIGYFGVLEPSNRGLEDLLDACIGRRDVVLHVVGYGSLEHLFSDAATRYENVIFYGPKSSEDGLRVMNDCDVLVGLYYKNVKNHLFAAPNKYYDHLLLGKAMLTTEGIPTGEKVTAMGTGWAIAEGASGIRRWMDTVTSANVRVASEKATLVWMRDYRDYYQSEYAGRYLSLIKSFVQMGGA